MCAYFFVFLIPKNFLKTGAKMAGGRIRTIFIDLLPLLDKHKSGAEEDGSLDEGEGSAGQQEGEHYTRAEGQREYSDRLPHLSAISHDPPPHIVFNDIICEAATKVYASRDSMR